MQNIKSYFILSIFALCCQRADISDRVLPPIAADNPIRSGIIKVTNFPSPLQVEALAQTFDHILQVDRGFYVDDIAPVLKEITFGGATGLCSHAGAYLNKGANHQLVWCERGALTPQAVTAAQTNAYVVFRSVLLAHEILHAHGLQHDRDNKNALPCTGTSKAARIALATFRCQRPYCLALREQARQVFLSEMEYNFGADPRRYQGLCRLWLQQVNAVY